MPKQPNGTPGKKPPAPSVKVWQGGKSRRAWGHGGEKGTGCTATGCFGVETLLKFLPAPRQPRTVRYGVAIVLVAVFFLFSLAAGVAAGRFEFLLLILPVLLASVLYDRGSGFLATGLGVLAMASQFDWRADPVGHLVALVIFAIVALFIVLFCEALRSALERGPRLNTNCNSCFRSSVIAQK
jgi:hypothetical protein